jgi:hypothetical protein
MDRRMMLPVLVLGLLGALSVGAVILGLSMAPTTADLLVHNGAGELTYASSLTATYSNKARAEYVRVHYVNPDEATEALLQGGPHGTPSHREYAHGTKAMQAIAPFTKVQKVTGFTASGSNYLATEPASSLYTTARGRAVTGTVKYLVTLQDGYLVNLVQTFNVQTPVGPFKGQYQYQVTHINGQPISG